MTDKIKNIIPITYAGGSGGAFLSNFLNMAYFNDHSLPKLSHNGNAHLAKLVKFAGPDFEHRDQEAGFRMLMGKYKYSPVVIFTASHFDDTHVLNRFKKYIKIVIEPDDAEELALCFTGKYKIDILRLHRTLYKDEYETLLEMYRRIDFYQWFYEKTNSPSMIYLTWKELVHGPANYVIEHLSKFTNIPIENFNEKSLSHWRQVTVNGIEETRKKILDKWIDTALFP